MRPVVRKNYRLSKIEINAVLFRERHFSYDLQYFVYQLQNFPYIRKICVLRVSVGDRCRLVAHSKSVYTSACVSIIA